MSTIRPTDRELVPVGWVQTSWSDTLQFAHRQTGLRLEAVPEGPSCRPGVDESTCWALRCRKSVGETETTASLGRVATERQARQRLDDWMDAYNRLRERYDWNDTVAVGTVADKLSGEREYGLGVAPQERGW